MRNQDEDGPGGRFLEPFKEGIGRVGIHVFCRVHERDTQPSSVRAQIEEGSELAHLIDLDLGAGLLGAAQ